MESSVPLVHAYPGLTPAPPTPPPALEAGEDPSFDTGASLSAPLADLALSSPSRSSRPSSSASSAFSGPSSMASPAGLMAKPGGRTSPLTLVTSGVRTISPPTPAPSPQPHGPGPHRDWGAVGVASPASLGSAGEGLRQKGKGVLGREEERPAPVPSDPLALLHSFTLLSPSERLNFLTSLLPFLTLPELTTLSSTISPRLKRDFLRELPIEIALHILSFVDDPKTLMRAGMVSRFWRGLVSDEVTWKGLCWRRGFSGGEGRTLRLPNLRERMDEERRGRVEMYRAGVESERRRRRAAAVAHAGARATAPRQPSVPPQELPTIGMGLGVVGAPPARPFAPGVTNPGGFIGPVQRTISDPALESDYTSSSALASESEADSESPADERWDPLATPQQQQRPRQTELLQPSPMRRDGPAPPFEDARRRLHAAKVINATSPEPGQSGPAPTDATSPKRSRPRSMPMMSIPTFPDALLDSTPSNPLDSPTSLDLDSPPASPPSAGFSYKSYFKRAYLTESNWLRGPGRILSTQTSQADEVVTSIGFDDEWIVIGMATNEIHVFAAPTGEYVRTLSGHELGVWALALVSRGGERDPRDVREPKSKRAQGKQRDPRSQNQPTPTPTPTSEWTPSFSPSPTRPRSSGLGVSGAPLSPLRHRTNATPSATDLPFNVSPQAPLSSSYAAVSPRTTLSALGTDRPGGGRSSVPASIAPSRTPSDSGPRRPRRPSSFSSFMSSAHSGAGPRSTTGLGGGGGMGLGAGGDTGSSAQHASACGVSRGWGQPRTIVVSGGCDRDIRVWDVLLGQCLFVLRGHSSTIRCLRVLDGRPIAVSGSRDASLRVWDIERGVAKWVLAGHTMSVRALEVSGNKIVSGSYDTTSRLWDADTGQCLRIFRGHYHPIYAVAFDGLRIATGSLDSTVCIWSAETGDLLALLQGHTSLVGQVQINGPSDILMTGGSDGRVIVFNLKTFECVHRICAHDNSVTTLQGDDRFIVTGGNDGRIKLWDMQTGAFIRELVEPCEAVWRVTFRNDHALLLVKRNSRTSMELLSFRPTAEELE